MKVAVIGAGIIGTSSALCIKERYPDIDVDIIAKDFSPNTTSDVAAGYWEPIYFSNTPIDRIKHWAKETYDFVYQEIRRNEHSGKNGMSVLHGFVLSDKDNIEIPFWSDFVYDFRVLPTDEIRNRFPDNVKSGFAFTTTFIEGSKYIPSISKRFLELGGKVICKELKSLDEISSEYDIVVNCTGLGSQKLLNDKVLFPIRGQIMRVKAPWAREFMIFDTDNAASYILPNQDWVVIGGTKSYNDYDVTILEKDRKWILDSTIQLMPSLKQAEVINDFVGLRPGRDTVRLERENVKVNTKNGTKMLKVVHNYGHGGSGITLHRGCALETTALFTECLSEVVHNKSKL